MGQKGGGKERNLRGPEPSNVTEPHAQMVIRVSPGGRPQDWKLDRLPTLAVAFEWKPSLREREPLGSQAVAPGDTPRGRGPQCRAQGAAEDERL